jgi:hypothetical protein
MNKKIESFCGNDGSIKGYLFHCPGCGNPHAVFIAPHKSPSGATWTFNGDMFRPTFSPSILQRIEYTSGKVNICHSFVTDGNIIFLPDCTHKMAGKTVPLLDVIEEED